VVNVDIRPTDIINWFQALGPLAQIVTALLVPTSIGLFVGWFLAKAFHRRETTILERQHAADLNLINEYREKLKGASPVEAASRFATLENDLAETRKVLDRLRTREWQAPTKKELAEFTTALGRLGLHTIRIASSANTDCAELAHYLSKAFEAAGWRCELRPETTFDSAFARGVLISGKAGGSVIHDLNKVLFDILGCSAIALETLKAEASTDIELVIGPKFPELS